VPASALRSIPSSQSSLVLSADLPAGQLLLRPMLVTPAQTTSGLAIPPGMMALTISFCLPEDVAGAVQPGSLIAVFDTVGSGGGGQLTGVPGCTGAHTQVSGSNRTRVVLNRVLVLSVGASQASPAGASTSTTVLGGGGGSSSSSPSQGGTLVTVAVNQADAEKLIQLTETGMPYLALLTPGTHITADVGDLLSIRPPNPTIPRTTITLPIVTPTAAPAPAPAPPAPAPNPQPSPTPNHPK
jgi:pilus assembly protein CpaB